MGVEQVWTGKWERFGLLNTSANFDIVTLQLGRPYENGTGSTTRVQLVNCPKEVPFFKIYDFKEISCGLEHVVALVDISRHPSLRKKFKDSGKAIVPADADTKFELLWQDMKNLARGEEETIELDQNEENMGYGTDDAGEGRIAHSNNNETIEKYQERNPYSTLHIFSCKNRPTDLSAGLWQRKGLSERIDWTAGAR